jgi:hypothetical protein
LPKEGWVINLPEESNLRDVSASRLRANPDYQLIVSDRLPEPYAEAFSHLQQDPDFYGFLWPRESRGLNPKAVCQDTALLFYTLQEPGLLPTYARRVLGDQADETLAQLILDGVLEIESQAPDQFVSGAQAHQYLYRETRSPLGRGRIAELSRRALAYAEALPLQNSGQLSARLYFYNTVPVSPGWRHRLPDRAAVASFLGIEPSGRNRRQLDRDWARLDGAGTNDGWLTWRSRRPSTSSTSGRRLAYKLYLSPLPEALPDVWGKILTAFAACQVPSFKVGDSVYGLLRPDKIVAYCTSFDELANLAADLDTRLEGCPAQGVPFTAGIDPTGLLSWGMDPPHDAYDHSGQARESWRLWVTNRLAVALLAAKTGRADPSSKTVAPWEFAVERLRLAGVDTTTWTPRQSIWQQQGGA